MISICGCGCGCDHPRICSCHHRTSSCSWTCSCLRLSPYYYYSATETQSNQYMSNVYWWCHHLSHAYPLNELLECFGPILVDVFLCCSDDVFALAEDILHVGHVPYVNGLLARDKVRPDDVVIDGCCAAEVRYHEPAREDELRVCPERKPNHAFEQYGFINMHFAYSLCSIGQLK